VSSRAAALERVRKLVALAASSSEEEARTSALIACRLILEHGFVVGEKPVWAPKFPAPPPPPTSPLGFARARSFGECAACSRLYFPGEEVVTMPGLRSAHVTCGARYAEMLGVPPPVRSG
jgi:hypothetical protein